MSLRHRHKRRENVLTRNEAILAERGPVFTPTGFLNKDGSFVAVLHPSAAEDLRRAMQPSVFIEKFATPTNARKRR